MENKNEKRDDDKKKYERPGIESEEVFDSLALACGGSTRICSQMGTYATS